MQIWEKELMKIVLSEYSSGFSDYSWILCNELIQYTGRLVYLTEQRNSYISQIDQRTVVRQLFLSFKMDEKHKKGSFLWLYDRGMTALRNCIRRNRYIKKTRPDAVLIQVTLSVFDSHFLKQLKKYSRIVMIVHDVIVPVKSLSWNKSSLKKTYDTADLLVVHSETNKKQMMEIFGTDERKIKVIPHGIRSTYHKLSKAECRKRLGISSLEHVFLFYGSIRESKGLDLLIEAMKGIDGTLIISGMPFYGESFDKYKAMIHQYKIKTIEFIEYTEDSFRDILFQASDYMVLPYKEFYSQSGVFMQSIQFHLPVIASDVSSFREYIEKYDIGYICEPGNADSLHQAMQKACHEKRDYELQMKRAVRENCWEETSKMYYELLSQCCR